MKIAILGTRGIPNNYGGFEQFAEYISVGLVKKGHDVTVYNPHFHPYNMPDFKGVNIITIKSPEEKLGSAGNFIYDYNCLKDATYRRFDIIYEAGYATCSPFFYLIKSTGAKLITNMDGLEWKRSKWNFFTKKLMKYLERNAVKKSQYIIADNKGIQQYYRKEYNKESFFIPYGANVPENENVAYLEKFDIKKGNYFLLIARLEPENNIELIFEAYIKSQRDEKLLVIGDNNTKYARFLANKFKHKCIQLCGGIYNKEVLDSLRFHCKAYLHGHSVGGTNPSLLEAMASSCFIIAHKNSFNSSVLKECGVYFDSIETLKSIFTNVDAEIFNYKTKFIQGNLNEINENYNWQLIIDKHEKIFKSILSKDIVYFYVQ
jgi:glycosyltransferase involved in cell wall biosynthesis